MSAVSSISHYRIRYETYMDGYRIRYDYPAKLNDIHIGIKIIPFSKRACDSHSYLEKWTPFTYAEARDIITGAHRGYEFFRMPCRKRNNYQSGCALKMDDHIIIITATSHLMLPPFFHNVHITAAKIAA